MLSGRPRSVSECAANNVQSPSGTGLETPGDRQPGGHAPPYARRGVARTLVLGLGNDILTDDGVGLRVVRQLEIEFDGHVSIDVRKTSEMGLALLDFIVGYSKVILVDSIQTGQVPPGSVHELDARTLSRMAGRTPHFLGIGETLALGKQLGLAIPEEVQILAIEVQDPYTLSEEMTPPLRAALPRIVQRIVEVLKE